MIHSSEKNGTKRLRAVFYRTAGGREPVRDWLRGLEKEARKMIGTDIKTAEFGWPLGMPVCRFLRDGIWEIRSRLGGRRISRVFFCIIGDKLILLHGFIKKTSRTPRHVLDVAARRKRSLEDS